MVSMSRKTPGLSCSTSIARAAQLLEEEDEIRDVAATEDPPLEDRRVVVPVSAARTLPLVRTIQSRSARGSRLGVFTAPAPPRASRAPGGSARSPAAISRRWSRDAGVLERRRARARTGSGEPGVAVDVGVVVLRQVARGRPRGTRARRAASRATSAARARSKSPPTIARPKARWRVSSRWCDQVDAARRAARAARPSPCARCRRRRSPRRRAPWRRTGSPPRPRAYSRGNATLRSG